MKIILDVMSGDYAPHEIIKGAAQARDEWGSELLLVGRKETIFSVAEQENVSLAGMTIIDAPQMITMEDHPKVVLREKKNSSMGVGLKLLSDGVGDAFVSAGNTGALNLGSSIFLRRVPNISRAAIATIMPLRNPVLLMDSGASPEVNANELLQFAKMGSLCMERVYDVSTPRIGLLNNGAEENKGRSVQIEAHQLLAKSGLNFIGNIEAKDLPFDVCDVIVTDGFTGNILLKFLEGMGRFMLLTLKDMFYSNAKSKISAFMMKEQVKDMKTKFDVSEYGGAPLLGISKTVIKAHGNSNARAIKNAIRQAESFVRTGVVEDIALWASCQTENRNQ